MRDPDSGLFLEKLYDLMDWSVPRYVAEGKAYLTVAIGCTGGRHRSVVVSEKLGAASAATRATGCWCSTGMWASD